MRAWWVVLMACVALAGCKTTEQLAAEDHTQCIGMGAKPGDQGYFLCRQWLAQQRAADRAAMADALLQGTQGFRQPVPATPVQKPVTCYPVGRTVQCW